MEFKRDIEVTLKEKLNAYKKPIMIIGARQIGKTTAAKKVANEYGKYIYINLEQNIRAAEIFEGNLVIDELILNLSVELDINITSEHLLIIDEIQSCPRAITSLKYFAEDGRYKVVATGSMLGITMFSSKSSYPVGKVDILNMYQLSFFEFLEACNKDVLLNYLKSFKYDKAIPNSIHDKCLEEFDKFIELGGYPEVVSEYITENYMSALEVSKKILEDYKRDISKYADDNLTSRIQKIYKEIDAMLTSDNQKFRLTQVDKDGYRSLEYPIHWLINANLAIIVHKTESSVSPLHAHIKDNQFKLFLNDTGLLMRQSGYKLTSIQSQDRIYYGIIIENYIAQVLSKSDNVYYYQKNTNEIDFLHQVNGRAIPIEVKSGNNTKAKSLTSYIEQNEPKVAIKISKKNFSSTNNIINVPLYLSDDFLSGRLESYVD